jgi:hypothetical protein
MAVDTYCRGAGGDEMTSAGEPHRHLSPDGFRQYLASGAPSVVKIEGAPPVYFVIDPSLRRLSLRAPMQRYAVPDLSAYRYISAAVVHWNDGQWCELRVEGDIIVEAYPILCAIADRLQLRSMEFSAAIVEALGSLRELLAARGRLSEEQEIGLFGELILLRHLLRKLPVPEAIASWRGPEGEEHDFALHDGDVEVKSTTLDTRCHWISDVHQLEPTVGRPLRLMSIQLTGAGASGLSLPQLVEEVRASVPDGESSAEFSRKLAAVNWRSDSATLYTSRFRLRTIPAVFDVGRTFPALTPAHLLAAGLEQSRFRQIRYSIDLTGLLHAADNVSALLTDIEMGN